MITLVLDILFKTAALLCAIAWALAHAALALPAALLRCAALDCGLWRPHPTRSAVFYEGTVLHSRSQPVKHQFTYHVRMALIGLDDPPASFAAQSRDHMTADEARAFAGTAGAVKLLTHPQVAGYVQNPISVYYCSGRGSGSDVCIAEVTNTPWGERVTFLFDPRGEATPKALHVSPLMDMRGEWTLRASEPGEKLSLTVDIQHPEMGHYFVVALKMQRSSAPQYPSESAGLRILLRYGFQPHRVAFWIYWQAVLLLWKGVRFVERPSKRERAAGVCGAKIRPCGGGRQFVWRDAQRWPWADADAEHQEDQALK